MNKKISVIVPVYNVEKYLNKCLFSIVNQTYKNLEIIIVNDGSTDKTVDIFNRYKEIDKRVIIINEVNSGVSVARNNGLSVATGDYISFVDGDDFLDLSLYSDMIKAYEEFDCDVAYCSYKESDVDNSIMPAICDNVCYEIVDIDIFKKNLVLGVLGNYLWSKLWKRECFSDVHFPEKRLYEIFIHSLMLLKI